MGQSIEQLSFLGAEERRHLKVIAADLRRRSSVLFCGAGLSFNARRKDGSERPLPGWWQLTSELAEELPGVGPNDSALRIADLYESAFGRTRLIERLQALIPDREYEPGIVHELIPLMGFKEIITTNFDTLIERAFRRLRVNPRVVVNGQDLVASRPPRVLKINGCFERSPSDVVITGEDFRRYDEQHTLLVSFLTNCFVENLVLFIGFSLDDPAFRAIFGRVRDILGKNVRQAYSIQAEVPQAQVKFWKDRGLNILSLYSGEPNDDLDFAGRLLRVLRALLEEAKLDLFSPPDREQAKRRVCEHLSNGAVASLRGWLWDQGDGPDHGSPIEAEDAWVSTQITAGDSPPSPGGDPAAQTPSPPPPARALRDALEAMREHPRIALAALLPPSAWSALQAGGEPTDAAVRTLLDRPDAWGFALSAQELGQVEGALSFLRSAVGRPMAWQRTMGRLLGHLLEERFHPLRAPAGALALPWCRQVMLAIAKTLEPEQGGASAQPLMPEIPTLLCQVYLLAWIEDSRAGEAGRVARERMRRAWGWLDLRCLAAADAARQREAVPLLLSFGASEDIELILDLLVGAPVGERLERRLRARAAVWRSVPMVGPLQPSPGAEAAASASAAADAEAEQARDVATRIRDLAPDFQFRFVAFFRDPSHHQDLYGTALDWIREQVFTDLTPWEDPHKLGLVYRHHYLYQDYGDQSRGEMDWPFHKQVQDQLVALYQRSESRRTHPVGPRSPVRAVLQDLMLTLGRGKALHVMPPRHLDHAWASARAALQAPVAQPVPWELLLNLSLPADGSDLIDKRAADLVEVLERGQLDLPFFLELWLHRLGDSAFSRLDSVQRDGRPLEDAGGLGRSLAALASFLRLCMERREWDPLAERGTLLQLVQVCRLLLTQHHAHPHVRTHMGAVLASLSRLAPPEAVGPVVEAWMALGTSVDAHTSLGLGDIDWQRLLSDPDELPQPDQMGTFHLTRQLLARAMGPLERRTDLGRDLQRWALKLYALDREGRRKRKPEGALRFQLPRDVRILIGDHLSRLLAEEAAQPSLAWLNLARQAHEAGIEVNTRLLFDDEGPSPRDPLLTYVERWCCALPQDSRLLKDWHWTLASCVGCVEVFIPTDLQTLLPGPDAPDGAALVAFVLAHLDPGPTPDGAGVAHLDSYTPDLWDAKRVNATASFVATLLHRTRKAPAAKARRDELVGLLCRLLDAGATGEGTLGLVVDLLPVLSRDRVELNHRVAMLAGHPEQQAAGVERARRFLKLAARGEIEPFHQLEAQLIQGAAGVTRPRRDHCISWLSGRLVQRDALAFAARHRQSLRSLQAVLRATELPRPPAAARLLMARLADLLDSGTLS